MLAAPPAGQLAAEFPRVVLVPVSHDGTLSSFRPATFIHAALKLLVFYSCDILAAVVTSLMFMTENLAPSFPLASCQSPPRARFHLNSLPLLLSAHVLCGCRVDTEHYR